MVLVERYFIHHPCISPFIILTRTQVAINVGSAKFSRHPYPKQCFPVPPTGFQSVPRPTEIYCITLPMCSGSTLGSHISWTCIEDLQWKVPWSNSYKMPKPPTMSPSFVKKQQLLQAPTEWSKHHTLS